MSLLPSNKMLKMTTLYTVAKTRASPRLCMASLCCDHRQRAVSPEPGELKQGGFNGTGPPVLLKHKQGYTGHTKASVCILEKSAGKVSHSKLVSSETRNYRHPKTKKCGSEKEREGRRAKRKALFSKFLLLSDRASIAGSISGDKCLPSRRTPFRTGQDRLSVCV